MNLLESGLVIERSLSKDVDHNRLVNIRMNKTNRLKKKMLFGQVRGKYVLIYFS